MGEWKECKLGDVAGVQNGYAFKSDAFNDCDGIPVVKIKNVASGKLDMRDVKYYQLSIKGLENFLLNKNDILITMTGSHIHQPSSIVGKVARYNIKQKALLNQRVGKVYSLNDRKLNEDYLYHFLSQEDVTYELALNAGGSANQANISPDLIKSLNFLLPPLPEQKTIAGILSSLDDKIDLLHRQNKTLEAMAEVMFRQWFVEPCVNGLPDGWVETKLYDICSVITKGTTPTTLGNQFVDSGINFIKVESITDEGEFLPEKFAKISSETHNILKRSIIKSNDVLCSIAGTIGRIAIVNESILPANTNQAIAILRVDEGKCFNEFIYLFLKSKLFQEAMEGKIVHAVQPNLSLGEIGNSIIFIPSQEELQDFKELIAPTFLGKKANQHQIRILEKIRGTLLPKLMSGEVRVTI